MKILNEGLICPFTWEGDMRRVAFGALLMALAGCSGDTSMLSDTRDALNGYLKNATDLSKFIKDTELKANAAKESFIFLKNQNGLEIKKTPNVDACGAVVGARKNREVELTAKRIEGLKNIADLLDAYVKEYSALSNEGNSDPIKAAGVINTLLVGLAGTIKGIAELENIAGGYGAIFTAASTISAGVLRHEQRNWRLHVAEVLRSEKFVEAIADFSRRFVTTFASTSAEFNTNYNTWFVCSEAVFEIASENFSGSAADIFIFTQQRASIQQQRDVYKAEIDKIDKDIAGLNTAIGKIPETIQKIADALANDQFGSADLKFVSDTAVSLHNSYDGFVKSAKGGK